MDDSEGYKIRVQSSCILEISGKLIELPVDIPLNEGWNIISFPLNENVDAMEVMQPLIDNGTLEKVQDESGNSFEYWGNISGWINGIGSFRSGEGYLVKVNRNDVLNITGEYGKSGLRFTDDAGPVHFKPVFDGNGFDHMNINITGLDNLDLQINDELAAFDGDKCVGVVKLSYFNITNNIVGIQASVSDKDILNGFTEGNRIRLFVWRSVTGTENQLQADVLAGNMIYQKRGSVFIQLIGKDKIDSENNKETKFYLYPNPASEKVTLKFISPPEIETKIIVSDITGNIVLIKQKVESPIDYLDTGDLSSGVYFVKLVIGENQRISKLIIN